MISPSFSAGLIAVFVLAVYTVPALSFSPAPLLSVQRGLRARSAVGPIMAVKKKDTYEITCVCQPYEAENSVYGLDFSVAYFHVAVLGPILPMCWV